MRRTTEKKAPGMRRITQDTQSVRGQSFGISKHLFKT